MYRYFPYTIYNLVKVYRYNMAFILRKDTLDEGGRW